MFLRQHRNLYLVLNQNEKYTKNKILLFIKYIITIESKNIEPSNIDNKKQVFVISKKISLKRHPRYNEKWLQDIIEEHTELLGLGELMVIRREHTQSSGGRMDFLLSDPDTKTLYEVEIQLGKTDPSHIIRTIEYWDLEKSKNPNYEHRAVIIAEEITNRFFNVISLMNKSIPIITIQLNALQVGDNFTLDFMKILDIYETPEDDIEIQAEEVGRSYWEQKSGFEKALLISEKVIEMFKNCYEKDTKITYNKYHIAVGTELRNCLWLHPRKSNYITVDIKILDEDMDLITDQLNEIGVTPSTHSDRQETIVLAFPLKLEHIEKYKETLKNIITSVIDMNQ